MRRYNIVQPYLLSFFSKDLYVDVARNWPGFGLVYLLLLLALAWVPTVVQVHLGVARFVEKNGQALVAQVPKITITNGQVSLDPPGPHYIKDPESGSVIVILDTSADIGVLGKYPEAVVLLTRTQVITREEKRGQTRVQDLAGINSFSLDQAGTRRFLSILKNAIGFIFYPFALLFSFIYRTIQVLLYAVIGLAMAGIAKSKIEYGTLVRLACIAVTPVILVDTVLGLLSATPPYWWLLCFIIAMWYLWFGVKAATEAPAASADSPITPATP